MRGRVAGEASLPGGGVDLPDEPNKLDIVHDGKRAASGRLRSLWRERETRLLAATAGGGGGRWLRRVVDRDRDPPLRVRSALAVSASPAHHSQAMGNRESTTNGAQDDGQAGGGAPDYYALLEVDDNATADEIRVRLQSPSASYMELTLRPAILPQARSHPSSRQEPRQHRRRDKEIRDPTAGLRGWYLSPAPAVPSLMCLRSGTQRRPSESCLPSSIHKPHLLCQVGARVVRQS